MEYCEKHERLECLERLVSAQLNRELRIHKSLRKHGVLRETREPGAPRQHPVRIRRPKVI